LARKARAAAAPTRSSAAVMHRTVKIDGMDIFYGEASPTDAPTVLLLHGFPTSSHMFRRPREQQHTPHDGAPG
jgi:pimeloyl-ACP methyl ester carboxylesterase